MTARLSKPLRLAASQQAAERAVEARDERFPPPSTPERCWCDRSAYRPHPQTPGHGHGRPT